MDKYILFILFIIASSFIFEKGIPSECKNEKVFELKAGKAIMKISTYGGRIISFRLGNIELITNKKEHENFGSTLWTSPQSDWGWPPYKVLDSDEYTFEKIRDTLKMISKLDFKSGFQFEKKFVVTDNSFIRIEYQIRNISKTEKKVAAWEVTRVPCGGMAFFPEDGSAIIPPSTLKIDSSKVGINWVMINKKISTKHQKLFATAREGWLAYTFHNVLFIKQFPDIKLKNYSPQQGEIEIYVDKDKKYAELENHGSYSILQPGQVLNYVANWYLSIIPKKLRSEAGNTKLSSLVRKRITVN